MKCYLDGCNSNIVPGFAVCLEHITSEKIREAIDRQIEYRSEADAWLVRIVQSVTIEDTELLCAVREHLEDLGYWYEGQWTQAASRLVKHWSDKQRGAA